MSLSETAKRILSHRQLSLAETVYLSGPGTLRVRGKLLLWQPIEGLPQRIHPKSLRRILIFGTADVSGVAFCLLWHHLIEVVFLSAHGNKILSHVSPGGSPSPLARHQWQCCSSSSFALEQSRLLVRAKIESTGDASRYYQRQGKSTHAKLIVKATSDIDKRLARAKTLDEIRGIEGSVAAAWWRRFASMIDTAWSFQQRRSHPSPDPVNAMLSLGYTILLSRAQSMLSAHGFDNHIGFLHAIRPGRPSLACDLIEPFRIPVVDRTVLRLIGQRTIALGDFSAGKSRSCELSRGARNSLIGAIEKKLNLAEHVPWSDEMQHWINRWDRAIRKAAT